MKRNLIGIGGMWCLLWAGCIAPGYAQTGEWVRLPEAGEKRVLHAGWHARRANEIKTDGNSLTAAPFDTAGWLKARVPGTVLATLLENRLYPAPERSMNNELIPDIYDAGNAFYTYWFVCPFRLEELPEEGRQVWLNFRGINYKADIFLNGKRLNADTHEGMFLRESYPITPYLKGGKETNLLAVIVYPPDDAGNPNGGQGGDGRIARNVTMQFTPGWDWIQPVRDRNTGIWDEVSVTVTGAVKVQHPYVTTRVPGVRLPEGSQKEAFVAATVELENTSPHPQTGTLVCETNGVRLTQPVRLAAKEKTVVRLKELPVSQPRLWWPNGVGKQELYAMRITFETATGKVSDSRSLRYGIREITSGICPATGGRKFYVNGQPVYMPGGNYIASDWLLRLSPERYRAEIRFHAEMNLRMIRVWGGALLERPEFYDACDEYGLLVFQDLWGSGDCNGAWEDPMKADSRERRWEYPDNHSLFLASVEDQVKMIRNHPSLCLWCGANEWPLARDIDEALKNDLFPRLDPNRLFISYSTDTLFTRNTIGGVGDGPYGIQEPEWFFTFRSTPFNPEAGSVGSPEIESMREMMTDEELSVLPRGQHLHPTWRYHRDLGYGNHLERYGEVADIDTYCKYAQAVNYDQYRSFMEGRASHMWEWYTGILIWKTQNPWTSLRGQMYDWYLDVNASLYGTRKGCEPLHPQYHLTDKRVELVNTALGSHSVTLKAQLWNAGGTAVWEKEEAVTIGANEVKRLFPVPEPQGVEGVYFLKLELWEKGQRLTTNVYWLTTRAGDYTTLSLLPRTTPAVQTALSQSGDRYTGTVRLRAGAHISFFNRIKVFDKTTGQRILPVHYSDNYITLMPGDEQEITLQFTSPLRKEDIDIAVNGWNM
ncbi:MAG: beta-glycosidase [Tannerellaceae bacterium]|jgi:hypothetical protein|nr:beta-glycosidase [Tannerellaceae bacterium]